MIGTIPVYLEKERYRGLKLPVSYMAAGSFRLTASERPDGADFRLSLVAFSEPQPKAYDMDLYPPYFENAEAYGILDEGDLVACVEISEETWNKRLRITELWVKESHRRMGFGGNLLEFAKKKAVEKGCRLAILETQTCNLAAIALYRKHGFSFVGIDTTCYSNHDVEDDEVRVEMGWKTGAAG